MFEVNKIEDGGNCHYGNCKETSIYELTCITAKGLPLRNKICLCEKHFQELKDFLSKN